MSLGWWGTDVNKCCLMFTCSTTIDAAIFANACSLKTTKAVHEQHCLQHLCSQHYNIAHCQTSNFDWWRAHCKAGNTCMICLQQNVQLPTSCNCFTSLATLTAWNPAYKPGLHIHLTVWLTQNTTQDLSHLLSPFKHDQCRICHMEARSSWWKAQWGAFV